MTPFPPFDGGPAAPSAASVSALSADFTPEGAQAFFDYHQQQKEKEHERSARQAEAAE